MSTFKKYLILALVVLAIIQSGLGGLRDMFGLGLPGMSAQHGWSDANFLLLLAILVALTTK
jgi:hypothetical protein